MKNKKTKKKVWNPRLKRFVAFFDILGFKELVLRESHKKVYDKLFEISKLKDEIEKIANNKSFSTIDIHITTFSDSIFIFSDNQSQISFQFFLIAITYIFQISIGKHIPMKGTVAFGDITVNKSRNIFFGQPIIDAYLLEEEVNYLGIVFHHSVDEYITSKNFLSRTNDYFEAKVPLKSGKLTHNNLNWFSNINSKTRGKNSNLTLPIGEVIEEVEYFKRTSSGYPRKYVDNTINVINEYCKVNNITP